MVVWILSGAQALGQDLEYEIAKWYDFQKSAVVLTFDDWSVGHPTRAVPELNQRNMKASFYINSWAFIMDEGLIDAVNDGHEVGNHGATHVDISVLPLSGVQTEMMDYQATINSRLPAQKCLTISYPFGLGGGDSKNDVAIQKLLKTTHIGARRVASRHLAYDELAGEFDYFRLPAYAIQTSTTVPEFQGWLDASKADDGLLILIYHGIGSDDNGWSPITQDMFRTTLDRINSERQQKRMWVATMLEALQYHRERRNAELILVSKNNQQWVMNLTDGLDNAMFFQPLTLSVTVDPGFEVNYVVQNGEELPFTRTGNKVVFNAVPDNGPIIFSPTETSGVRSTQDITFAPIEDKDVREAPFTVEATATSGLPVSLEVVSGPADVNGKTITLTGQTGEVVVRATQGGDTIFLPADPVLQTFNAIRKKDQSIVFDSIQEKLITDGAFQLSATSSSGLPVTFELVSGPATLTGNTVTPTGEEGPVVVRALQLGNDEYYLATPVERTFNFIAKKRQTIAFAALSDQPANAPPIELAATASSGLPVSFNLVSGPATLSGNVLTLNGNLGTVTVEALQEGNGEFLAADKVARSFQVFKKSQTIVYDTVGTKLTTDKPFELVVEASSGLPITMAIARGPAKLSGKTIVLTGVAGTVAIRVNQTGNEEYSPAPETFITFEVAKAAQTITVIDTIGFKYDNADPFTLTAVASSGLPVTMTVKSGPAFIEKDTVINLTGFLGDVTVTFNQKGNDTYHPAPPKDMTFKIYNSPPLSVVELSDQLSSLKVYPNPANETLFVEFEMNKPASLDLLIYDLHGRAIRKTISGAFGVNRHALDLSELPAGVYYLQLKNDQVLGSGTFIVK